MTNYITIKNLFTEILKHSNAIQGRFYFAHRYALQEANYDQLGQVLDEYKDPKKYPMVVAAPPSSNMKFSGSKENWEEFRIILYFCKTTHHGVGAAINPDTMTSQHSVLEDWHDMKRCALGFFKALINYQRSLSPSWFILPQHEVLCTPFAHVGADRVSGVHMHFDFKIYTGCELEDYKEYPTKLKIELDGHNEHEL